VPRGRFALTELLKRSNRRAIHLDFYLRASHDLGLVGRNKMKQKSTCVLFLLLAISVKVQGMTLYSTMDTNSTEGNYFGALYFSFSITNDSHPFYSNPSEVWWNTANFGQTFTDPASGSQINIGFTAGLAEAPDEFNLLSVLSVNDPALGTIYGGLGNNSNGDVYDEAGRSYHMGQTNAIGYLVSQTSYYYSWTLNTGGNCSFGYSLTGYFDGTSANAAGSWYFNYTVPPITPAPEPAVTLQLALGGCCLWLARARQRRRN
jgi:ribosomal protein L31